MKARFIDGPLKGQTHENVQQCKSYMLYGSPGTESVIYVWDTCYPRAEVNFMRLAYTYTPRFTIPALRPMEPYPTRLPDIKVIQWDDKPRA